MKLRLLPVLITAAVSSVVLFGGWFAYLSMAMENPLKETVDKLPNASLVDLKIGQESVEIALKLDQNADLKQIYNQLGSSVRDKLDGRSMELTIIDQPSAKLEKAWSEVLFTIAEAMGSKQYSRIPLVLNELVKENKLGGVNVTMDDKNVYIELNDGSDYKVVILPRQPAVMEAWGK